MFVYRTIWKHKGTAYKLGDALARRLINLKYVSIKGRTADRMGTSWLFGHRANDRFGDMVDCTVSHWEEDSKTTRTVESMFGGPKEVAFNGNNGAVLIAKILSIPALFLLLLLLAKLQYGVY